MPYARFLERVNVASSALNNQRREALERVALQGWLGQMAMGGGGVEWLEYRAMILGDPDADADDVTRDEAMAIGERIAAMDKASQGAVNGDL